MRIGVILHSQTGNTFFVGQKIKDKLELYGHNVVLLRMTNIDNDARNVEIELDQNPEIDSFEALVFGGWIQAFSLCPGMMMYLEQLPSLKDKKVTCFLTQYFPYKWMGGSKGLSKMKKIIASKGTTVLESGIINWSKKNDRFKQINNLAEMISKQYSYRDCK